MALLASPDVGVRRRALLRNRSASPPIGPIFTPVLLVAPARHDIASASAEALARRRINLMYGRRTAELRARFHAT